MERPLLHSTSPQEPDLTHADPKPSPLPDKPQQGSTFGELVRLTVTALVLVFVVRTFIAQPFIVSGASMEDTFSTGQYLIIDQATYHFSDPERGDVVVFRYPRDPSKYFIKRVIGIPGDTLRIEDGRVYLSNSTEPEAWALEEPYASRMDTATPLKVTLGSGEYFVMGDNRNASSDSRMWGILPEDHIVGRAFLRLFPLTELEIFPGEYDLTTDISSSE